jgi:NitT/TauT family transport system substrate-binding protein
LADLGWGLIDDIEAGANVAPRQERVVLKRVIVNGARAAVLLGVLFAAYFGTGHASAADVVHFAWPGNMSSGYAPFSFAQDLGFFAEEGITIDTVVLQGAGTIIPQIVNGSITTGFITLSPLIVARQPGGPNFEIKYAYNIVPASIWELAVLDQSKIRALPDLAGKTIGVGALNFGSIPLTKALLVAQGVHVDRINFLPVGLGAPAFRALQTGEVDVLNLYDIMNVMMEQRGIKIRRLQLPAEFAAVSSYGLPFSNKVLAEKPDLVARFGRALAKGTVACKANPAGCLSAYWKDRSDQRPVDLAEETRNQQLSLMMARVDKMLASDTQADIGAFSDGDWTTTINALHVGEQISTTNIDFRALYTNALVPEFNRFNREEVVKKARAYVAEK